MSKPEQPGLVLARKVGQRVFVTLEDGQHVIVEVIEARGRQARLRFTSGEGMRILREELLTDEEKANLK